MKRVIVLIRTLKAVEAIVSIHEFPECDESIDDVAAKLQAGAQESFKQLFPGHTDVEWRYETHMLSPLAIAPKEGG